MTRTARLLAMASEVERASLGTQTPVPQWVADVRDVCKLVELAQAWDKAHDVARSQALIELRDHMKAMRAEL